MSDPRLQTSDKKCPQCGEPFLERRIEYPDRVEVEFMHGCDCEGEPPERICLTKTTG